MAQSQAKDFSGSMVALVTPMHPNGQIDTKRWEHLLHWHTQSGTNAVVVAGTTGESALLSTDEVTELTRMAVSICHQHDIKVIVGTGGIDPQKVILANQTAKNNGADVALVVTPYYLTLPQKALYQHFSDIASQSDIPIILYNVPSRTGIDMDSQTTSRLAGRPGIIGIKEAKSCMKRIDELVKIKDFTVLSGDDHSFAVAMEHGANGVISVAANVRPRTIKSICDFAQLGDHASAKTLDADMRDLYDLLFHEPNPAPVKALMHASELLDSGIRPPLLMSQLTATQINTQRPKIRKEMKQA